MSAPVYGLAYFALYLLLALITMTVIGCWTSRPPKPTAEPKPFLIDWAESNAAETPFAPTDEQHIQEALALVRPKPYPPLKSVR